MKNILENSIFLLSQIVCLILAVVWYVKSKEIEPLIGIIGFGSTMIISLFFNLKQKKNNEEKATIENSDVSIVNSSNVNTGTIITQGDVSFGNPKNQIDNDKE